jgi:arylformamidase
MIYDISPPVDAGIPIWPGDTPFACELVWRIADGAAVNVSAITTTPHLGAHADAPFHSEPDGSRIGELALEPFLGPCRVAAVPPAPLIEPEHLASLDLGAPPRLLLKTGSVRDRGRFPEEFSALSPRLARLLVERGALLVGLDTPSVDPFTSKTLEAHHILFQNGIANLEGLLLEHVPEGLYELIALPLRWMSADASPVRAVLRTLS